MKKRPIPLKSNIVPETERTPLVTSLLTVIEQLTQQLAEQNTKINALLEEIRSLKKLSKKPKLRASTLEKNKDDKDNEPPGAGGTRKRAGSSKRSKTNQLKIDKEETIKVKSVPLGSRHKGYQSYVVQDIRLQPIVTRYLLERWELPNGRIITAPLPKEVRGHHFGPTLRAYVLHQHHHQRVTQPLLRKQLLEWDIDISSGQLNRLLTEDKESFHQEKAALLPADIAVSSYIQVDDTGARHQGKSGYCTFIGNELFSWFESTGSKSRINFLELLRGRHKDYRLTEESYAYMVRYKVAPWIRHKLHDADQSHFISEQDLKCHLNALDITNEHYQRLVIEAALIGSILNRGFSIDTVIISDDAGQFNVFNHALCWIHAERGIKSLSMSTDTQTQAVGWARNELWAIYQALRDYKSVPTLAAKTEITNRFDKLCATKTHYQLLNQALKRLHNNKEELLLVLERPDIPLHNNLSERDIREYVTRRKISGSTRSDEGRRCRDTFASLKKTALKMGVKFWDYLIDRTFQSYSIPHLDELVRSSIKLPATTY
ncbi:IS66 family transposase [Legionella drancourtii]|nr:transposase [Legionella drancourtii]